MREEYSLKFVYLYFTANYLPFPDNFVYNNLRKRGKGITPNWEVKRCEPKKKRFYLDGDADRCGDY